jgi:hypothetical protein
LLLQRLEDHQGLTQILIGWQEKRNRALNLSHRAQRFQQEECVTIDDATLDLKISRTTLYNSQHFSGIQRHKFPFDRRTSILQPDLERIRECMRASRQPLALERFYLDWLTARQQEGAGSL